MAWYTIPALSTQIIETILTLKTLGGGSMCGLSFSMYAGFVRDRNGEIAGSGSLECAEKSSIMSNENLHKYINTKNQLLN